jgi:hypothetical protein
MRPEESLNGVGLQGKVGLIELSHDSDHRIDDVRAPRYFDAPTTPEAIESRRMHLSFLKILLLCGLIFASTASAQDRQPRIIAKYALDSYMVMLWGERAEPLDSAVHDVSLFVSAIFPAGVVPDSAEIALRAPSELIEDSPKEIVLTVDGTEEHVLPVLPSTRAGSGSNAFTVRKAQVPLGLLTSMENAKSIMCQMGRLKVRLTEAQRRMLRDFNRALSSRAYLQDLVRTSS